MTAPAVLVCVGSALRCPSGCPLTAIRGRPTAAGELSTAVGYPPTAVGHHRTAVCGGPNMITCMVIHIPFWPGFWVVTVEQDLPQFKDRFAPLPRTTKSAHLPGSGPAGPPEECARAFTETKHLIPNTNLCCRAEDVWGRGLSAPPTASLFSFWRIIPGQCTARQRRMPGRCPRVPLHYSARTQR